MPPYFPGSRTRLSEASLFTTSPVPPCSLPFLPRPISSLSSFSPYNLPQGPPRDITFTAYFLSLASAHSAFLLFTSSLFFSCVSPFFPINPCPRHAVTAGAFGKRLCPPHSVDSRTAPIDALLRRYPQRAIKQDEAHLKTNTKKR